MKDSAEGPSDPDDAKKREIQLAMIEILKRVILLLQIKQALEAKEMHEASILVDQEASGDDIESCTAGCVNSFESVRTQEHFEYVTGDDSNQTAYPKFTERSEFQSFSCSQEASVVETPEFEYFDSLSKSLEFSLDIYELFKNINTIYKIILYIRSTYILDGISALKDWSFLGTKLSDADIARIREHLDAQMLALAGKVLAEFILDRIYDQWEKNGVQPIVPRNIAKSILNTLMNMATLNLKGQVIDQSVAVLDAYQGVSEQNMDFIESSVKWVITATDGFNGNTEEYRLSVNSVININNGYVEDVAKETIWISDFDVESKMTILNDLISLRAYQKTGIHFGTTDSGVIKNNARILDENLLNFYDLYDRRRYQDFADEVAASMGIEGW